MKRRAVMAHTVGRGGLVMLELECGHAKRRLRYRAAVHPMGQRPQLVTIRWQHYAYCNLGACR